MLPSISIARSQISHRFIPFIIVNLLSSRPIHCATTKSCTVGFGSTSFLEKRKAKPYSTRIALDPPSAHFSTSSVSLKRMGDSQSQEVPGLTDTTREERPGKIVLTDEEWKAKLTPQQYSVCRNHGTERAWTGDFLDNKKKGTYTCSCCGAELFNSSAKFDSGSGWPSFYDVLKDKDLSKLPAVDIRQDSSHGMVRTEVMCGKCASHLGHVFNDGPRPTGLRYCINSVSLKFKSDEEGSSGSGNTKNGL